MAVVFSNNAITTLAASVSTSGTTLTVDDGSSFPTISLTSHTYVTLQDATENKEVVKVTAINGNTFTVVRARDNTTARAFSIGDKVELRLTAVLLEEISDKVVGLTGSGTANVTGTYPNFTVAGPTAVSALTNDSNFLNNSDTISGGNF